MLTVHCDHGADVDEGGFEGGAVEAVEEGFGFFFDVAIVIA